MRILIIGSGGREHALIMACHSKGHEVHSLPKNQAFQRHSTNHDLSYKDDRDNPLVLDLCKKNKIDLVVIGPENVLVHSLADELRKHEILVFAPSQKAAELEKSKIFSKEFMLQGKIPTARAHKVKSVQETLRAAESFTPPYVLKADGLAAGKGVFVCPTKEELIQAAKSLFEEKKLGSAGDTALLEEHMVGTEVSLLVLTNGQDFSILPMAQDHKRLLEQDQGPNTGGMGTVAPIGLPQSLTDQIVKQIIHPTLQNLQTQKLFYRGVLFIGLMLTDSGPMVLEYNVRFGDPETQVILPLLEGDWAQIFWQVAKGKIPSLVWKQNLHSACVVLASPGYPDQPQKGLAIEGDVFHQTSQSYFLHAGTACTSSQNWQTAGGRVLNAIGLGETKKEALKAAYSQAQFAKWQGQHLRKDIGEISFCTNQKEKDFTLMIKKMDNNR